VAAWALVGRPHVKHGENSVSLCRNSGNHLITIFFADAFICAEVDIGCPQHQGKLTHAHAVTCPPFLHLTHSRTPLLSGSDSHYAIVHGTQPIAQKGHGVFPDGDEIVIFDADAVLPQVTSAHFFLNSQNNV